MAPIRRYLRITKYSVLEVRIYLDNPALADSWLLNRRSPVLPRVIESVRPLVLPKLREENERTKGKGKGRKKGVKDVVVEDDFEVSIFLTEKSTRHAILAKQKQFKDQPKTARSIFGFDKITGSTTDTAIQVNEDVQPALLREESDDSPALAEIPEADDDSEPAFETQQTPRRSKRARAAKEKNSLFVASSDEDEEGDVNSPPSKRSKKSSVAEAETGGEDDKKKMAMRTTYDGFSIYGRVLCLIVKRRDTGKDKEKGRAGFGGGGQAMMEDWISTQMPPEEEEG